MNASSSPTTRPFAIVTGASSGIGYELARCCAEDGHDLLIVADEPRIEEAASHLRRLGVDVRALQADLATPGGVDQLISLLQGRPVDALLANAGRGLGQAFLDQDLDAARRVVDTNVTGTVALVQKIGRRMRDRGTGRILITGSIAGFMPGSYQAVYNGTKAFLDSFAYALREELRGSGVSVTCLMPGPTDTEFFARAGLLDTKVGTGPKDDAAMVARAGYRAMVRRQAGVVTGAKNKVQAAMSGFTPATTLAHRHAKQAAPGTAKSGGGARAVMGVLGTVALVAAVAWWLAESSRPAYRRSGLLL